MIKSMELRVEWFLFLAEQSKVNIDSQCFKKAGTGV